MRPMRRVRTIAALAVASMLAFCPAGAPAAAQESGDAGGAKIIPPSVVYRIVKEYAPGATVLRVTLQPDTQIYAVRLRSGNTVRRLLIDGKSGRIVGE
jgi:uncharacterized membrane protein YkoI